MGESVDLISETSPARRVRSAIGRIYRRLGPIEEACGDALRLLAFLSWTLLVRLKLSKKEILVFNCGEGREEEGFYAQLTVILGLLEHFEKWGNVLAGVRVDFEDRGLYYDAAHGNNSWEYFFQPVDIGRQTNADERTTTIFQEEQFATRGEHMPRSRALDLIERYIHIKPPILKKIDSFVRAYFEGFHVIGIHYRGTDKWTEAPRVSYEDVRTAACAAIGAIDAGQYRLFVASDEQAFVDFMTSAFPDRVIIWETQRAVDGKPIDFRMENNYKKGKDVVIDCVLLSRCHLLIRTSSHLGLFSTFFNPALPVVLLNHPY